MKETKSDPPEVIAKYEVVVRQLLEQISERSKHIWLLILEGKERADDRTTVQAGGRSL